MITILEVLDDKNNLWAKELVLPDRLQVLADDKLWLNEDSYFVVLDRGWFILPDGGVRQKLYLGKTGPEGTEALEGFGFELKIPGSPANDQEDGDGLDPLKPFD